MEISRSVMNRSDSSNSHGGFASRKSLYDGVFGSRWKIGIPVQSPGREEYSEIFGGFHASRSSSIPLLHIPVVAGDLGLHFDARGPGPDYTEVFGKVGGSAFAVSFEDVFRHDDPLSSVQSGSITEELDPLGRSDKNNILTNGDARQSTCRSKQFNASQRIPSGRHKELVCSKTSHISSIHDLGYGLAYYNSPVSSNGEDQPCLMPAVFGVGSHVVESPGRVKHHEKHLQDQTQFSSSKRWEVDFQPSEEHGNPISIMKKPFITISDVHLRTKPSKLPPPSRAPPVFEFKKSECIGLNSQRKISDVAIEMCGDNEMVFFDVEVDETCKQRENEFVKVVHTYSHEGKDFLDQKSNIPAIVSSFEGEEFFHSCVQEGAISEPFAEYGQSLSKHSQKAMFHHSHTTHNSTNSVTWREMEDYFEVSEKKVCKHHASAVEDYGVSHPREGYQHQKEIKILEFGERQECKDFKLMKEAPRYIAEMNQSREVNDHIVWDYDPSKRTPRTSSNVDTGFHNQKLDQLSCEENSKEKDVGIEKDVGVHVWEGLINWISDTNPQREECQTGPRVVEKSKHKKGEENTFILEDGRQLPHKIMGHKKSGITVAQCAHSTGKLSESSEENVSKSTIGGTLEQASNYDQPKSVLEKKLIDNTGEPCKLKGNQQVIFETKENLNSCGDVCVQKELYELPEENGAGALQMSVTLDAVREGTNQETFSKEGNVELNLVHDGKDKEHNFYLQNKDKPQNHEAYVMARKNSNSLCLSEPVVVDSNIVKDKTSSATGNSIGHDKIYSAKDGVKGNQLARSIGIRKCPAPRMEMKECQENEKNIENALSVPENNSVTEYPSKSAVDPKGERKERNVRNNVIARGLDSVTTVVGESELINDYKRKMEEEMERQREREKDRMGVSRETLEARTRPYSESLERFALERANAETKDRTNGARQWVSEKSFSEKGLDAQGHVDKSFADRRSASAKYGDSVYSSLPPDLHFQSAGAWGFPSENDGADGESYQRCKARLERYRRTEDRVANALTEKNKRDLLVQREKEDRNKVAVGLDAEIKRWSNGKEGSLRALLSTLQYILGPESGWQPISLTEVVTPAAVKKAYRKATLCVHPDKLQQRGATVHQKYICEKVFDLLKEAWNKFNSGEY